MISILTFISCQSTQIVSTESLLKEMIDKKEITYFPEYCYTTKQFSSYDRASDKNDKNDFTWFANNDRSMFIRKDTVDGRIENVMYDASGPGSVTRFWITVAGAKVTEGTIRIYIDGNPEPVLEGYSLDLIGSNEKVGYPLSASVSEISPKLNRGHNLYIPIPYSKHCKITYENDAVNNPKDFQSFYYNINYRTYQENTIVESFTKNTLDSLQTLIKHTNEALQAPASFALNNSTGTTDWNVSLKPSQSETTTIESKNSALSEIKLKLEAADMDQALRSTVIKISFDDNQTVWCPLGDFFATGYTWRTATTWRTNVNKENQTLSSTWVMPFEKNCKISIENLGTQDVTIEADFTQCQYKWNDRSMYFGSSWFQLNNISTGLDKMNMNGDNTGAIDVNFIGLSGKGVFIGDALSLYNTALPSWKAWWGEGDEKIYVDGEDFPSHFGTGTEDYYGYAWCRPEEFVHPFISQPVGDGDLSSGRTVNSRFRTLDAIPFHKSFKFDMELWHWSGVNINYAPTTFYYMLPGGVANKEIDTKGAKNKIARTRSDLLSNEVDKDGVVLSFNLTIDDSRLSETNGVDSSIPFQTALTWIKAKQSKVFDTEFSVPKSGKYKVTAGIAKNANFATVSLTVNDKRGASNVNCNSKKFAIEEVNLGIHDLKQKDNKLSIKVDKERNGHFRIDYVKVTKVND